MNILFLTTNPNLGSTARILQSWLLLGRREGIHGSVVAQSGGALAAWLSQQGIPHRVDPMPLPDRRWPFPSMWHAWLVARWARAQCVRIIHCNEHNLYPFGLLLRRLLGLPLVCHVRFRVERAFCEWAFRSKRAPDALLWTSRQQREDCAEAAAIVPPSRHHIVPLGLDLETFGALAGTREKTRGLWGAAKDEVVVGTASALRPIKRIEDFLALAAALAPRHPCVTFAVAGAAMPGDEAYEGELRRRVREAGLEARVRFLGHLEPVEPFMHAIDVFVSTSAYETFGNSVCEAMACRRPVAAYRGGSVHEVVGDAGRVVETGDLPALTAAVEELVENGELRRELGDRARQRVADHFNPAVSLQQLKAIYETLALQGERVAAGRPGGE